MTDVAARLAGVVALTGLDATTKGLRMLGGEVDKSQAKIDSFSKRYDKAGERLKSSGRTLTMGVTLPLVGLGVAAAKAGITFDTQMSKVEAKADATGQEIEALRKQAIDLGASTAFSATEAAQGMEELAAAGLKPREVMAAMPGLLDAAAASGEELAAVSGIVANSLAQFDLQAAESSRVADVLAKASNETQGSIGSMGEALKFAGTGAKEMGFSIEQTAGMVSMMVKAGIDGSNAGTAFRMGMQRVAQGALASERALGKLGKVSPALKEIWKSSAPVPEKVEKMAAAFEKLDGKNRLVAASLIFGTESASGMLQVMKRGPEAIEKWTKKMEESEGAAHKMGKTMRDNLGGDLEQLGGALESTFIGLQTANDGWMRSATTGAKDVVNAFGELPPGIQQSAVAMAGLATAAGPAMWALGSMGGSAVTLASGATTLAGGIGSLAFAATSAIPALEGLSLAIAANPALAGAIAVGTIAAAGYALYKFADGSDDAANSAREGAAAIRDMQTAMSAVSNDTLRAADARLQEQNAITRKNTAVSAEAAAIARYGAGSKQAAAAAREREAAEVALGLATTYRADADSMAADTNEKSIGKLRNNIAAMRDAKADVDRVTAAQQKLDAAYASGAITASEYYQQSFQNQSLLQEAATRFNDAAGNVNKMRGVVDTLSAALGKNHPLVKTLISLLEKVPPKKTVKVEVDPGGLARQTVKDIGRSIVELIPDSKTVQIKVSGPGGGSLGGWVPGAYGSGNNGKRNSSGGGGGGGGGGRASMRAKTQSAGGSIGPLGGISGTPTVADVLAYTNLAEGDAWTQNKDGSYTANSDVQKFLTKRIAANTAALEADIKLRPLLPAKVTKARKRVEALSRQLERANKRLEKTKGKKNIEAVRKKIRELKDLLEAANDNYQRLSGKRFSIADDIIAAGGLIDQDMDALVQPANDSTAASDTPSSGSDSDLSAQLAQQTQVASTAVANARLSNAALSAFSSSGDIGRGGANAFGAAGNTGNTFVFNSPIPYSPQQIMQASQLVNQGNAMGSAANKTYTGRSVTLT